MARDFGSITERPGDLVTPSQLAGILNRYELAANIAKDGNALECACGSGIGLPMLRKSARRLVAGDLDAGNVSATAKRVGHAVSLLRFDAQALPFRDGCFDAVLMLEAIYYFRDPARAVREAARVLRPTGRLLIVTANPAWRDFGASPMATCYLDSRELVSVLESAGFHARVLGAFAPDDSIRARATSLARRVSRALRLPWPRFLRQFIRETIQGPAVAVPSELSFDGPPVFEEINSNSRDQEHSVIYAVGTLRRSP